MLPNVEAHHREPAVEGQELRVRRSKQNEASQGAKEKTAAMVDTLLKDWKQYMATDEYRHDVERARKDRTEH